MTTSTITAEIEQFASAVRTALGDLPAEEVDDLTDGLEADLAESFAEDLRRELPDPVAYAAELRTAAGMPERPPAAKPSAWSGMAEGWSDVRRDMSLAVRRHPALAAILDFVGVLRPAWWIARAWLATWIVSAFFGGFGGYWPDGGWWLVLIAFTVLSVQWGRGLWRFAGVAPLIAVGNVVAILALLPVLSEAHAWAGDTVYVESTPDQTTPGLYLNGLPLENIYVYDADGNPLKDVQLFDVDGNPLEPVRDVYLTSIEQQPKTLETGTEVYNVYPLHLLRKVENEYGDLVVDPSPDPDKVAAYRDGPFVKVPGVMKPQKVAQPNQ